MKKTSVKIALTIAGSDSGGGAGIQADLKTFSAFGVFGTSAITAITAQNTVAVTAVVELPADIIAQQIDAVVSDLGVDAAKTGMLASAQIIEIVVDRIKYHSIKNLVVDPVMISKTGHPLLKSDATQTLIKSLIPLARVVTPNLSEAEIIVGRQLPGSEIDDYQPEYRKIVREIFDRTGTCVILKGGHIENLSQAVDFFYDGSEIKMLVSERVDTVCTHGTGCTFSAAIAAGLAQGLGLWEAAQQAKHYITQALKSAIPIGHGFGPVNPFSHLASK